MTGSGQLIVRGLVPDMALEFNVKGFQFNSPSEHVIGDQIFDMEMQIIHSIVPDYLPNDPVLQSTKVVISVLFAVKPGANNTFLSNLNLNTFDTITNLDLKAFLGSMSPNYIYYQGSLTTPPCTENVHRFIMMDIQEISMDQLKQITDFYPSNSREEQPLNGRSVVKVTKRMSRSLENGGSRPGTVFATVAAVLLVVMNMVLSF